MTAPRSEDVLASLARMTDPDRAEWVSLLERAAANLSNAAYAFSGNAPDAKPDPDTWAANMLWLAVYQLEHAMTLLGEDDRGEPG